MTFSTLFHAAPQDLEVNSATFYFNKSVVINNTIRHVSKLNTKIFQSNKIADSDRDFKEQFLEVTITDRAPNGCNSKPPSLRVDIY